MRCTTCRSVSPTVVAVALLMAIGLHGEPAWADELTAFGAGAQSISMAGGGAPLLNDSSALFAAPAGIAFGESSVDVGFMGVMNRLGARLSPRPPGYEVPDLGSASPVIPYQYRLNPRHSPSHPPGFIGFSVGATVSLGLDWLRVGVMAFVPTSGLGRQFSNFADERAQYFSNTLNHELYGEQLSSQQTLVVGAIRPVDWLGVAAGMRFAFATKSDALVLVPNAAEPAAQETELRAKTAVDVAPVAGVAVRTLNERARFTLTYRDELVSTISGMSEVQTKGFEGTSEFPFRQPLDFVVGFLPRQLVFAGAYRGDSLAGSIDLTWSQWSRYRDSHNALAGFRDTWSVALGGEVDMGVGTFLRSGLGFRPSPVPDQTGRTNYVDNDMLILGLGSAHQFKIRGAELEASLFGQVQFAMPRSVAKARLDQHPNCAPGVTAVCDELPDDTTASNQDTAIPEAAGLQTGNPGFPGYTSGGWITAAGVQLTWRYQ